MWAQTDPPGYCSAQNRFIDDSEFVDATFGMLRLMREELGTIVGKNYRADNVRVNDVYFSGFRRDLNKSNCCDVARGETEKLLNRIFRLQTVDVRVWAQRFSSDDTVNFHYDVCGHLLSSDAGLPSRSLPYADTSEFIREHNRSDGLFQ